MSPAGSAEWLLHDNIATWSTPPAVNTQATDECLYSESSRTVGGRLHGTLWEVGSADGQRLVQTPDDRIRLTVLPYGVLRPRMR